MIVTYGEVPYRGRIFRTNSHTLLYIINIVLVFLRKMKVVEQIMGLLVHLDHRIGTKRLFLYLHRPGFHPDPRFGFRGTTVSGTRGSEPVEGRRTSDLFFVSLWRTR